MSKEDFDPEMTQAALKLLSCINLKELSKEQGTLKGFELKVSNAENYGGKFADDSALEEYAALLSGASNGPVLDFVLSLLKVEKGAPLPSADEINEEELANQIQKISEVISGLANGYLMHIKKQVPGALNYASIVKTMRDRNQLPTTNLMEDMDGDEEFLIMFYRDENGHARTERIRMKGKYSARFQQIISSPEFEGAKKPRQMIVDKGVVKSASESEIGPWAVVSSDYYRAHGQVTLP